MQGGSSPATSEFEQELADYMKALRLPTAAAQHMANLCSKHDFSAARVHLIISRPGYHSGASCLPTVAVHCRVDTRLDRNPY